MRAIFWKAGPVVGMILAAGLVLFGGAPPQKAGPPVRRWEYAQLQTGEVRSDRGGVKVAVPFWQWRTQEGQVLANDENEFYKQMGVVALQGESTPDEVDVLNKFGAGGWELVSMGQDVNKTTYVFRREK